MTQHPLRSTLPAASLALFTAITAIAQTGGTQEPALSPAQSAIVNRKIAALHTSGERNMAQSWTNAKKVGEVLCRPAALSTLRKKDPTVDKVFLGTSAPETLKLESNQRLTGSGQSRTPQGWTEFNFTCDLDPKTGKVTNFQTQPLPPQAQPGTPNP
jgi:hypothetical protein